MDGRSSARAWRLALVVVLGLLVIALLGSLAFAATASVTLLAKSSTSGWASSASRTVYLRDDPDYRRDLARARSDLAEAQAALREAERAIQQIGEPTPKQKRLQEEFLRPYREDVREAKAWLAEVQGDYLRPFRSYGFRVRTVPAGQLVELQWIVSCFRGSRETRRDGIATRRAPFDVWQRPTTARAHRCDLSAFTYRERGSSGRMTTSIVGRR